MHVPESWEGSSLTLQLGKIDDADAAYFNGAKIGSMGGFPPDRGSAFKEVRRYTALAEAVRCGEDNIIAIRERDFKGYGGLYELGRSKTLMLLAKAIRDSTVRLSH